jgi:toxin ParE1/3/4
VNRFVLSTAAQADLEDIWDYTCERWSVDQAETYVREIQRAIERLADNPLIGRPCDEVREGYRKHAGGSHRCTPGLPATT